jgi:hypothetical protein
LQEEAVDILLGQEAEAEQEGIAILIIVKHRAVVLDH